MNTSNNIHVVFGAGSLGIATAQALIERGLPVRIVSRSGKVSALPGVQALAADVTTTDGATRAAQGAAVIHQCLGLPYDIRVWRAQWPAAIEAGLAAAQSTGAKFIFGDNLYAYGDTNGAPVDEQTPETAKTQKGMLRIELARSVRQAHDSGRVQTAIVRGSDFIGPNVLQNGMLGERGVGAMLSGKPAQMIGNIDLPHSFTAIQDFGRAMAIIGERDSALGQTWHAPTLEALSMRQIMGKFFAAAGLPPKYQVIPKWMLKAMGVFMPMMRELNEMNYSVEKPYIIRSEKIARELGVQATPLDQVVAETLAWFKSR